jgi:hypothetical protein
MIERMRRLLLVAAVVGCSDPDPGAGVGATCSQTQPCANGTVCDFTADGGPVCVDANADRDGDGLLDGVDFCIHKVGGKYDEDGDGMGDECDPCPIAPPRSTPDPDGDLVESPCDPDPSEPGDEILFFDGFGDGLAAGWTPTTAAAWSGGDGEIAVDLASVTTQDFLQHTVIGQSNVAIEASYCVDRVENSATRHLVAVYAEDPRPAGVAQVQCGVSRADATAGDLVVVQTNAGAMSQATTDPALLSSKVYRVGTYVSGTRAGCSAIADNDGIGSVQATITADDLSSIALTAQAVSVRFQYVIVVGR